MNRLIATVFACSLLLGCRPNFQVPSGNLVLGDSRETISDRQITNQASVPDAQPLVLSDLPHSGLPIATTLPSVATSTVLVTLPTCHLAARSDTVSSREQASSTESEETDAKPAARSAAQVAGSDSMDRSALLYESLFQVPLSIFGSEAWRQYFGEVGKESPLPSDIDKILDGPCPFWPGKQVKATHLLVLIPSTVAGKAFTLDLLEELTQNPLGDGHRTQYFLYDDEVQRSSGDVYSSGSYWVLLTRDVLPGSRNEPYEVQQALITAQSSRIDDSPYAIPNVLEAATAILSHYVRSGERLYEGVSDALPSTSTRCTTLLEDASGHPSLVTVGRFCSRGLVFLSGFDDDVEFGVSCLRRFGSRHYRPSALLHSFGAEEWRQYFGEVGEAPPLPAHIFDTLNGACPFWPEKVVKDTHLLVLIPATVNGEPFSLILLGELIGHPRGGGYSTQYGYYNSAVQEALGTQSPGRSYWVLMTRDVLEGSRGEDYAFQQDLVAQQASRTGLPYEIPGALEAATAILSYYVRSGERLYADAPWTYTRCQEQVAWRGRGRPVVVGGFSSVGGVDVDYRGDVSYSRGVASLRRF